MRVAIRFFFAGLLALPIVACGNSVDTQQTYPDPDAEVVARNGRALGGIVLFGDSGRSNGGQTGGVGIGVNSFLWRATLDSIAFMPLSSADPFGGVIITDWYASPENPNERFKVTVYVLDRDLRADALKAAVFRQTRDYSNNWVDASVDPKTAGDLENAILTRARQLRLNTTAKN
jgi:hypothetical protein